MRFMMLVKSAERPGPPPKELMDEIAKLSREAVKGGTMIESGGLAPTAMSTRVRVSRGQLSTIDGPFTETKEVVGGYAVFELKSKEEAIEVHGASWNFTGNTGRAGRAKPKSARCSGRKTSLHSDEALEREPLGQLPQDRGSGDSR